MSDTKPTNTSQTDNIPSAYTETQQQILAYARTMKTPLIIKGTAGSGKSKITMEIADIFLKMPSENRQGNCIGVAAYTNKLIDDLQKKLGGKEGLKVLTAHKMLNEIFLPTNKQPKLSDFDNTSTIIKALQKEGLCKQYTEYFLKDEINLINNSHITSLDEYKKAPRIVEAENNTPLNYEEVWNFYCKHQEQLHACGMHYFSEIPNVCLEYMAKNPDYVRPFTHLIIDEFQNLGRSVVEALCKCCQNPNNIVFVGDLAQSIFKNALSWKEFTSSGKKVFELNYNFRNTRQIAHAAQSLLDNEYKLQRHDPKDYTQMIAGNKNGAKPVIAFCRSPQEQEWYVRNTLARIDKDKSVAFICRDTKNKSRYKEMVPTGRAEIITMHSCQGLEFDNVFILDANEGILPNTHALENNEEEGIANERRILYVAMTRARENLFITTSGKPSRFLAEIHPFSISPVALNNEAYEELYKKRVEELLQLKEKLQEKRKEIEKLEISNREKDAKIAELEGRAAFADYAMSGLPSEDRFVEAEDFYRSDAKILIISCDNGIDRNDTAGTLKKQFGFNKNDFEFLDYAEAKSFNHNSLEGSRKYCDVIIGCAPHKHEGGSNLWADLKKLQGPLSPKIHFVEDPNTGKPAKLSKESLIKKVQESRKWKWTKEKKGKA